MSKPTITMIFVGSLIAIAGGVLLVAIGVLSAIATGSVVMSGSDIESFELSTSGSAWLVLAVIGALAVIGGGIAQVVAWLGAVINTARLDDKTWFLVLLLLGLLSFGFVAMLVYVIVGPDGTVQEREATSASHPVAV